MSSVGVWFKQAVQHPGWTRGATAVAGGTATVTVAAAADEVIQSRHRQGPGVDATPGRQYYNTIETLSQHNSETSGTGTKRGRLLPAHMVDGIQSGVAQAFGVQPNVDHSNQSLAYQYRFNEWQDLSRSLTHVAQGVALALTPSALGWGVARLGQWVQAARVQGLATSSVGRGFAEVGVAALIAHADPMAIAVKNRSPRSGGGSSGRAVATEPHRQEAEAQFAYLSGPEESWRLFDPYQMNARNGARSGDPFTSVHASAALGLMEQARNTSNINAYIAHHYRPGKPLVIKVATQKTKELLTRLARD